MKIKILLVIIVCLAAFLRFFQLGVNPPSLTWDEAAWGYNAYSLGIDGKDEFGKFLPYQYLESFGDFKPPLYAYLDIIPIKVFGLNEFATRFPSAFFGTLSILIAYYLTKRIFSNSKQKEAYALGTAFLLAISPWHILLSRAAFEANVATFLLMTGVYCFLEAVEKRKYFMILSAICFVLALYTFNSARVVAPLLICMLVLSTWKKLWNMKKMVIVAGIIGLIMLLPTAKFLFSPQAKLRFQEVNIFTDSSIVKMSNHEIANDHNAVWSKAIHNRRVLFTFEFLKHYFDNLSANFLFITGDGNPKFSMQTTGQLYLWEIPLLSFGIFFLFKKKEGYWWLIPIWLLIAIIPAAVARETPHALRIEGTLPTFQLFVIYGVVNISLLIHKYKKTYLLLASCFLLLTIGNFIYAVHEYAIQYPIAYSGEWQYGYKDAITYMRQQYPNYNKIYLTGALGRPYIYTLFYNQYSPQEFRTHATIQRDAFGFVHIKGFDKYIFGETEANAHQQILAQSNTLYVDTPDSMPKNAKKLKTFYLLNGSPVLVAYTL